MRKAIIQGFGGVDQIQIVESEVPTPKEKEVLVKVGAAGLNPKDVLIRKGKFRRLTGSRFPQSIGFEFAGVVQQSNSSQFKPGEEVFGMLNGWHGRCCAGYVSVQDSELYQLPNLSFTEASGIPLAGQTALQAIRDLGRFSAEERILINGASGGVGTLAIQIAKALGGAVTTLSSQRNLELCLSLGADHALPYEDTDLSRLPGTYHLLFDAFGNLSFRRVASLLTSHGRYVTTVPKPSIFKEQVFNLFRSKKARMVYVRSNTGDLRWLHERIVAKQIRPVVDKVFDFNQIREAQQYIETKRARGKVVLSMAN